jgi:RNA polymerase sigma factor (sigma-70 family)
MDGGAEGAIRLTSPSPEVGTITSAELPHVEGPSALVLASQAGDERAFATLVRSYQDLAVAYATGILGDYHLAQDAAQEAFVEAYRALPSLREPAAFAGWLRRIVFKHCDRITRRKEHRTTGLDAALDAATPDPSPHDTLEANETRRSVHAAIATLSEAEQQVVLLYYMGEQSQAEIAEFLNVTANTVKTRLYAARRRLRAHMSELENRLDAARPSLDSRFAEKVRRMIQPEALKQTKPWMWSPGIGTDVWAMFTACILGDLATVKELTARDPSLVRCHYEYRTPLSFAVRENHVDVAAFLLDQGAARVGLGDPLEMARDRGYREMTGMLERKLAELHDASARGEPIAAAIRERDLRKVRRLLDEEPELVHAGDSRSSQPIHWAAMTRQLDVIDEVLGRGADINARRLDGAQPIHLGNGDYFFRGWRDVLASILTTPDDVFRHLVAQGAEIDMGMAAATGNLKRVRELLALDPSLANKASEYNSGYIGSGAPIRNAASGGHIEIVKLLLAHGADPNLPEEGIAPRGHALYSAVYNRHYDIAKLLLEHGAHPDQEVESSADAVWIAIRNRDHRMIELLGSYGANWDIALPLDRSLPYATIAASGIKRPLKILAQYGDLDAATAMLAASPELADDPDALRAAAGQGNAPFVQLLLGYQPELAKRVTVSKPREMAVLLFAHGMDPNRPAWLRATPLHNFASNGDIESAALFLEHGADLHARDEEYCSTPLAWAAREGQERMVEFLLQRGAKPRHPADPEWATPIAWATRRRHERVLRLLARFQKHGELPVRSVAELEILVNDLVSAYSGGDEPAVRRIAEHFRVERQLNWDRPPLSEQVARLRRGVRERLNKTVPIEGDDDTLDLVDARFLIARSEGFESWAQLVERRT